MIATVLALVVTFAGPVQEPTPSAKIGFMLAKYNSARTLTGTIVKTEGNSQESGQLITDLQYERPAKLYIRQTRQTISGGAWTVTSDGKYFSYDKPDTESHGRGRLLEEVDGKYGRLKIAEIYAASSKSLADRSAPLDMAISRPEDLQFLRNQWATVNSGGTKEVGGEKFYVVSGKWRTYGEDQVSGNYEMWISATNDLRMYVVRELIIVGGAETLLIHKWDVNLKVDDQVNPKLFKVIL